MPDPQTISYTMNKLPPSVTLHVSFHLSGEFKVRRWIATQLLRLAAWVLGCGIEVEDLDDPERTTE